MGATSDDEATAAVSQEPLTLPSAMNHRQVVFHKRAARLYFALKSSSKFLFFTMIALVLRSVGFNPLQVGILRAASALSSIMFVEFAMICIRSPKKRKILAHLCLALASASVLAYLVIPPAYEHTSSTSLMPQHCHTGNYSLNVNGTRPAESDLTDDPQLPSPTVPGPVISISELGTAANIVTEASAPPTHNPGPSSSQRPYAPFTQPANSITPVENIKVETAVPPIDTSGLPNRGGPEPDWVKGIIDAQNRGSRPSQRRKRAVPNILPDEPSGTEQQQVAERAPGANPNGTLTSEASPSSGSPRSALIESFWETLTDALSGADSPHSLMVACFLLLSLEVYFSLSDRIGLRLYINYLDQMDKNFDHLPYSHFATLFTFLASVIVYVRYQCTLVPGFELPTALLGACGVILGLATLMFTCFPVPETRKILERDSVNPVKLTVSGNRGAMLIFLTLVVLGVAFGVEQNFLLWHLVDIGTNIGYITLFIGTPVLVSALFIARTPRRIRNIHRFLLAALVSVSIRFVSYSFYSAESTTVKWGILAVQLVAPLSSTLLWKAVDSFLQQITFPNDHAPISRSMRFGFWGLGFSSGSLMAGYAWQVYKPSFFLLVVGAAVGLGAVALFAINLCVRIQDMKESHYQRILETESKQPINHFEETDDSDDDELDQVVEFQQKTSKRP